MKDDLKNQQAWMQWIVTDPRGVKAALAKPRPKRSELKPASRPYFKRFQAPGNKIVEVYPPRHLVIYAEGYFERMRKTLGATFERVQALAGEELFSSWVAEYLKAHPSHSPTLDDLGKLFPQFLKRAKADKYLQDLAMWEWILLESARTPIALEPKGEFAFNPSVRTQTSNWNLFELWKGMGIARAKKTHLMSFSNLEGLQVLPVNAFMSTLWQLLQKSPTLDKLVEHVSRNEWLSKNLEQLQNTLTQWREWGLVDRVD